ncbi:MAG: general secretion pathway protein GspA [Marinomonas sp.]|jgi:type II secretory pathway predicted ATPase ExeA|nr:general secretion pathway protein GspA [Marinomonas sp.]|tara:strand:- start:425 stop:1261 length:837 start_codon:yes stop_codon:yes gene_type:complete
MNKNLLALFGLAFNPFSPEIPTEALYPVPPVESFFWKVQQGLLREGGFALIAGEPGTGKSVTLRLLSERLAQEPDLVVGSISRPQAGVADFYREMGQVFAVPLRPHNRWGGSKVLRERWIEHIEQTLMRPVLLVDEAQEMTAAVLNELRFLGSTRFDSRQILTVVLSGDMRLLEKFRHEDLLPLGSRIRLRLTLQPATAEDLRAALEHLISAAGNQALMTPQLIATLSEHALGNYRVLMTLSGELLAAAAEKQLAQIDEKLYFELFSIHRPAKPRPRR